MVTDVDFQDAIPAAYGQACEECARSKTKCMLSRQGGVCQRCRRLNRDCRPAPARRRRRQAARNASLTTVRSPWSPDDPGEKAKRLEEKLQEVMTLLKSGGSVAMTDSNSSSPQPSVGANSSISSITQPPSLSGSDLIVNLNPNEADAYLAAFVDTRLQYLPFCHIANGVTSNDLRAQQPFLWLSIMALSATSIAQQRHLTAILKENLSQAMLRRSERSLDLLLGLLVMLGWNNRSTDADTKIPLSVLSQLAVALVYDLGLNKEPRVNPANNLCVTGSKPLEDSQARTMEERRAVLGCFVITSIISSFLQKTDGLRWTTHLSECLTELNHRQENVNDSILVAQVQAQLGVEKASMLRWYDETIETSEVMKAPSTLYVQALHTQIAEAQQHLPAQPLPKVISSLHLSTAELVISELTLKSLLTSTSRTNLQRLKFLMACLNSVKAWFETFFTLPIVEYVNFGFPIMSQLVRCLQLLFYLTTFEDSAGMGWNVADVRASLDVLAVMDQVINNLVQVESLTKIEQMDGLDYISATIQRFSFIRTAWTTALEGRNSRAQSIGSSESLWPSGDEELLGFEDWNSAWLDDVWSMDFTSFPNIGSA